MKKRALLLGCVFAVSMGLTSCGQPASTEGTDSTVYSSESETVHPPAGIVVQPEGYRPLAKQFHQGVYCCILLQSGGKGLFSYLYF